MLFELDDVIYRPARKGLHGDVEVLPWGPRPVFRCTSQAYRVLGTSGGMPSQRALCPYLDMSSHSSESPSGLPAGPKINISWLRGEYSELHVSCVCLEFNGIQYGTTRQDFVFKPFEGKVDIKSLLTYPIRFSQGLGTSLLSRGRGFLAATKVSHMQYEGLTAGSVREDINSPVVVDMTMAFSSFSKLREDEDIHIPELFHGQGHS